MLNHILSYLEHLIVPICGGLIGKAIHNKPPPIAAGTLLGLLLQIRIAMLPDKAKMGAYLAVIFVNTFVTAMRILCPYDTRLPGTISVSQFASYIMTPDLMSSGTHSFVCSARRGRDHVVFKIFNQKYRSDVEAELLLFKINHPNVVHCYGLYTSSQYFVILERLCGPNLRSIIQNCRLDLATRHNFSRQIIAAVRACHGQQIAHLDVRPEKFMIRKQTSNPELCILVLVGFSSAQEHLSLRPIRESQDTRYTCPQKYTVDFDGFAADVYAVSCILKYDLGLVTPIINRGLSKFGSERPTIEKLYEWSVTLR